MNLSKKSLRDELFKEKELKEGITQKERVEGMHSSKRRVKRMNFSQKGKFKRMNSPKNLMIHNKSNLIIWQKPCKTIHNTCGN